MSVPAKTLDREHDTCPKLIRANAQRWPDKETEYIVNHAEARFAVVEDQKSEPDRDADLLLRAPRIWESILTNVMVRVEDTARPRRAMVHFFLRLAGDARMISENEDIRWLS